jgi:hypothetical protein
MLRPAGLHTCLIFDDEEERQEVVFKFIEAGLQAGEQVSYFTELDPLEIQAWLTSRGLTPPSGHFSVLPAREVYCPDGEFVIERVLDRWKTYEEESAAAGFDAARATGETRWSQTVRGGRRIAEYCSRLNLALAGSRVGALCQFDAKAFDGATLFDILRVHPLMIVGTQVVRNPYYVPPERFLSEHDPGS